MDSGTPGTKFGTNRRGAPPGYPRSRARMQGFEAAVLGLPNATEPQGF